MGADFKNTFGPEMVHHVMECPAVSGVYCPADIRNGTEYRVCTSLLPLTGVFAVKKDIRKRYG